MQKKSNIKPLILTIIAVLTFTIAVVGASFAYFTAQKGTGSSANAVVKTETTDALTFQVGNPINIEANQANFGSGTGNKSYETTATVNLRAN
ncbi:MAG: hypothetical protein RSF02_02090, partial [Bacilli bacterium]